MWGDCLKVFCLHLYVMDSPLQLRQVRTDLGDKINLTSTDDRSSLFFHYIQEDVAK